MQGAGVRVADDPGAIASWAGHVRALIERRAQPLTRELHEAEAGDLAHLNARAVVVERVPEALLNLPLGFAGLHVDEVNDDEAAQVAQSQLAPNLVRCLEVGSEGGLFDVRAAGGPGGVDVHRDQCLGVVNDECPA